MENFKLFIQLTRLDKPIGYMLLFWPCLWGLTIAYNFENNLRESWQKRKLTKNNTGQR